eukprot:CAMPEP_0172721930 /NCGR_PEP_ID=MMETSP1074-20121228/80235_1 /TAXON_ID=2916 /ORGANISM="Ceratium fusus, Strain PA161109" /LENGTH=41 /DNA_ID= /DNA_START= /DNA_END= /DNA_ORIENTATION=
MRCRGRCVKQLAQLRNLQPELSHLCGVGHGRNITLRGAKGN